MFLAALSHSSNEQRLLVHTMHSARWFLVGQRCVLLALLLHLHVAPVQPFNVAVNSSRSVFAHRKAVGKQFGYSVTFKRDQTVNYLVVGTPLASDHKGLQSSGSTYRVALQDGGFNNPANIPFEEPYPPTNAYSTVGGARRYTERRDFQRLGAVVTTPSLGEDGVVLVIDSFRFVRLFQLCFGSVRNLEKQRTLLFDLLICEIVH